MFMLNVDNLKDIGISGDLSYVIPILEICTYEIHDIDSDNVSHPYKKNDACFIDIKIETRNPQKSRQLAEKIARSYGDPRVLFA